MIHHHHVLGRYGRSNHPTEVLSISYICSHELDHSQFKPRASIRRGQQTNFIYIPLLFQIYSLPFSQSLLLPQSRTDGNAIICIGLELRRALRATGSQDRVPFVELVRRDVVCLREAEACISDDGLGVFVAILSDA